MPDSHNFIVGTFNTPHLYTLSFTPSTSSLTIIAKHAAVGSHSWLHLNDSKTNLYATAWTEPPSVAAYKINDPSTGRSIQQISLAHTATRSGYVTATANALFSAGGPSGEVFSLDPESGAIVPPKTATSQANGHHTSPDTKIPPLQTLSFIDAQNAQSTANGVLDFGGLRHGAHSTDLSPSGHALYVADIGRNCIWTYSVSPSDGKLTLGEKHISPRPDDGPRHVWPHPNGKVVYVLQEHTSIVDVFRLKDEGGVKLEWVQGRKIVPREMSKKVFWADEVRTSLSDGLRPKYLYASTRGLEAGTKGWVAVYRLDEETGLIRDDAEGQEPRAERKEDEENQNGLLAMFETKTSGGWANAVQPGPTVGGVEYLALTDSEQGYVMVLGWDGKEVREVASVKLEGGEGGKVEGAATAVWLN